MIHLLLDGSNITKIGVQSLQVSWLADPPGIADKSSLILCKFGTPSRFNGVAQLAFRITSLADAEAPSNMTTSKINICMGFILGSL
ncbi:MAG TPA: hypothetical protein DCE18_05660, partial [Syntrophobacteraceae bacterium]|nr:hypothetical protein [Syntrophobacteraceae bacterium]